MSDFLDSLDIDIKSETKKRLIELEGIRGSHDEELLSLEQRKDRVDLLLDIVIRNLGIQLTSDLRDDILKGGKRKYFGFQLQRRHIGEHPNCQFSENGSAEITLKVSPR